MALATPTTTNHTTTKKAYFAGVIGLTRTAVLAIALPILMNLGLTGCSQADTTIAPQTETHSAAREAASILNNDSFDEAKMAPFWSPELMTPTAGQLTTAQSRAGSKAMRFGWMPAQVDGTNKMLHSELATQPTTDTERWYGYSSLLPSASMNDDQTTIVSQWHGVADPGFEDSVPPLRFEVTNGKMQVVYVASSKPIVKALQTPTSQKIIELGSVKFDAWVDYVVHVKWDSNGNTGVLQVWQDGKLVINEQGVNIGYPQIKKPFWKVGLYCWTGKAKASEKVAYCDEVRIGNALAGYNDVKPGRNNNTAK